jgi:hypothetical protein
VRAGVLALAAVLAGALAPGVSADSFTPVVLGIKTTPIARRHKPLKITVLLTADPGALDPATAPLRIRVRLAAECGGTFDTTPGTVLIDQTLSPPPVQGQAYTATAHGSARPPAFGVETVCAFLEEQGDHRMFANDTASAVDVSKPCTTRAAKFDRAHKALAKARRQLRHSRRAARRRHLKQVVLKRKHKARSAHRRAAKACGAGVKL